MYPNPAVEKVVDRYFIPVRIHVREQPGAMERFGVMWTPTISVLDPDGKERHRIEGYLPAEEFRAQLELGHAHAAFARNQFDVAERSFRDIVDSLGSTDVAPEAQYWAGVSKYKASNDPAALKATARAFAERYKDSAWAKKASVWN